MALVSRTKYYIYTINLLLLFSFVQVFFLAFLVAVQHTQPLLARLPDLRLASMLRITGTSLLAVAAAAAAGSGAGVTAVGACDASAIITRHEGSRSCAYTDTTGHVTVGVGFNMDAVSASTWSSILPGGPSYDDVYYKRTCLTGGQIQTLLHYSMQKAEAESRRVVSNYDSMCCGVQNVVTDMTFNLGSLSGFNTLVSYFEQGDYADAAADMKTTLWCRQVGSRCTDDAAAVARGCGAAKVLSENLLETLVAQAMASDAVQEEEAVEEEATNPACCFCSAGGDGDGACLTVRACTARALHGYKCGQGAGGCEWGPGGAIDPRPSCH